MGNYRSRWVWDHHDNTSAEFILPRIPLLYSKTWGLQGHIFYPVIALKNRSWVLVRTTENIYPQSMFGAKIRKISKFIIFTPVKNRSIMHGCVIVMIINRMMILVILPQILLVLQYLSRVMRKPTFCICENKDADQLHGKREADQRLCFRYTDSTIHLLSKSEISSL